jgi:hypothetical protein
MGNNPWKLEKYAYLAGLLLVISVPAVLATTLIGVTSHDSFIIAVDSKATFKSKTTKKAENVCKIFQSGPLYFAIANLAQDPAHSYFPEKIVANNYSTSDSFAQNVDKIELALSDALKVEMDRLKTENPKDFLYDPKPDEMTQIIIVGEMVHGTPQMFGFGLKYLNESTPISVSRLSCPGDCITLPYYFFAGETDVAKKTLHDFFDKPPVPDPVTVTRKLIEVEIEASPDSVGPPITILKVDKNGPTWISNDSGCPIVVAPDKSTPI